MFVPNMIVQMINPLASSRVLARIIPRVGLLDSPLASAVTNQAPSTTFVDLDQFARNERSGDRRRRVRLNKVHDPLSSSDLVVVETRRATHRLRVREGPCADGSRDYWRSLGHRSEGWQSARIGGSNTRATDAMLTSMTTRTSRHAHMRGTKASAMVATEPVWGE